jgi:hypothetical protein
MREKQNDITFKIAFWLLALETVSAQLRTSKKRLLKAFCFKVKPLLA